MFDLTFSVLKLRLEVKPVRAKISENFSTAWICIYASRRSCFLGKYPEIIIGIRSGSSIIKQPHVWPETARVAIMRQELNRPDRGKN